MTCRKDIIGRKIWIDDNNSFDTRPNEVEIVLYRDGEVFNTVTLNSASDGAYRFPCLIVWNGNQKYVYSVDEPTTPTGYTKIIEGNNVINVLNEIEIEGVKIWRDDFNAQDTRPDDITIRLYRNGVEIDTRVMPKPLDTEDTVAYDFGTVPFADANSVPYIYTVTEDSITGYATIIEGFTITNTLSITP